MLTKMQESYKDLIFYQIYPRSFKDSNNDGIGDIRGIIEKLDYLVDLGINAVWLSPCYKSPNEDNGYDISDYCDICDEFGTLDDWKCMIREMHKRGIKLIMDFVPNHTSADHPWFADARQSQESPYRDYYYWSDEPANDWKSVFGGSAWEYDEVAGQYYLHSFAVRQPDLNWDNKKVQEEMKRIIDFWVDLGVDGFRCDVMDRISKDLNNDIKDNGPHLHEYINMLFGREKTSNLFTVGECHGAEKNNIISLIDGSRKELSTLFQFSHLRVGRKTKFEPVPFELDSVRDIYIEWQEFMRDNALLPSLFIENHDTMRITSYYGNVSKYWYESATMLAAMYFLQSGVPFIFQGQEIGITNSHHDNIDDFDDIETHNYYKMNPFHHSQEKLMDSINFGSRDNGRRPMPWNSEEYGGFSKCKPWIPLYSEYKEINVEAEQHKEKSVLSFYKDLISLRKESTAIRHGIYKNLTGNQKGCYIYSMTSPDSAKDVIVVCNFEKENRININKTGNCVLYNHKKREHMSGTYAPYECAVFTTEL